MNKEDYTQLHEGKLRGNPCNIFQYLHLENDRVVMEKMDGRKTQSLRSYLGMA